MRAELSYISASCNRTPNICDWGHNQLICYGSCNSVIIYDPKCPGTTTSCKILVGHTKRVNAVRWVRGRNAEHETELLSASSDGTAIVWSSRGDVYEKCVLKAHEDGVNIVEGIYEGENKDDLLVVTASIDSTVRFWKRRKFGDNEISCIQVVNFKRGLSLALNLSFLPSTNIPVLACARDDGHIQLYGKMAEEEYKLLVTLTGHENWVRGLDFTGDDKGNLLLASSAQDNYIRIWCICYASDTIQDTRAMEKAFSVASEKDTKHFTIHLETVLCGHEGWVYEVRWHPKILNEDGVLTQPLKLLSSSLDKSMLIWSRDESSGLWMETMRAGLVGGNTLGFYGSKFAPDGQSIVGHGYLGSFHLWHFKKETNNWVPGVTVGGHSNEVVDIGWEPEGQFLLSVSYDQTTRLHVPWVQNNSVIIPNTNSNSQVSWHELARPQVHGYDMFCLAILSRYKFVSGAEEKIVRAFKAPSNFVVNFRKICNISDDPSGDEIINDSANIPKGAAVPSLGLSNKAVYDSSNEDKAQPQGKEIYPEDSYFHEIVLEVPPTEENLLQNTLWPEVQKLYGHGYELYSLAASYDGRFVASACKSTNTEHAAIILWDAHSWQQTQKLVSHTLTVTQILFSPDNSKLLSVSRDRRWSIFEKNQENNEFFLAATTDKKTGIHARIIWCCAWTHDSKYFATASRDGKLVVWWKNEGKEVVNSLGPYEAVGQHLELKGESITAVAFAPNLIDNKYLLCLGLDTGVLIFYSWNLENMWEKVLELDQSLAHHLTVKRIFFRPRSGMAGTKDVDENVLQVATCGSDHAVRLFNLFVN